MAFSTETIGRLLASGRNYVGQIIAFAGGIGVMSAAQEKGLTDALNEIWTGISQVVHGASSAWTIIAVVAAPIIGPLLARWASNSAKVDKQAAAIVTAIKDPNTPISPEVKAVVLEAATEVKKI